MVPGIENS